MKQYPVGALRPASFRFKAFAVHLAISLVVLGVLLYLLFVHWFPGFLFDTDGGWQALRVIAGVDIVLGPLLTLVAANPAKTTGHLRKDFTVIGLIQVTALAAGTWIAWENRPYALLWYDGAFRSMPYSAFRDEPEARAWIAAQEGDGLVKVFVDMPRDPFARAEVIARANARHSLAMFDATLYRPWPGDTQQLAALARKGRTLLARKVEGTEPAIAGWLAANGRADAEVLPVATSSRYSTYLLMLSATDFRVLGVADLAIPLQVFGIAPDQADLRLK